MSVIEISVDHFLPFDQGDTHNPTGYSITDLLTITDTAKNYQLFISAKNFLHLGQTPNVRTSIYQVSASSYFELHQQGAKGPSPQNVIDILAFNHLARLIEFEEVVHALTITDTVSVDLAKGTTATLNLTDSAAFVATRQRGGIQNPGFVSSVSVYKPDKYFVAIDLPTLSGPNAPEC